MVPFDGKPDLRVSLSPDMIGDNPGADLFLILPEGHWVEFGFPGPLVNGPGPDIEYHCLTAEKFPPIFLTDGDKQRYRLQNATRQLREGWVHRVVFDLAECKCPFTPTAIRVDGIGPPTQSEPITLINLKARIVAEDSGPAAEGR